MVHGSPTIEPVQVAKQRDVKAFETLCVVRSEGNVRVHSQSNTPLGFASIEDMAQ